MKNPKSGRVHAIMTTNNDCGVIDAIVDDDVFSKLLVQYVINHVSECSQEQFDHYYAVARAEGMSDREATENGLIMAVFNEMIIAALRADAEAKGIPIP
jgi:hypothetical protein